MAINRTEAILLRSRELRETSLTVAFYTRDFGKINGVIKGVRGSRSHFGGGALEPFAHDDIVFYEKKTSDIFLISQCDLVDFFPAVRSDLGRLAYAAYIIELLDSITPLGDRNPDVFELTLRTLRFLSGKASPRRVARIFEIRLLSLLGLMPSMASCVNCGARQLKDAGFSLRSGGLVCRDCARKEPRTGAILAGTVEFIKHIVTSDFETVSRIKVSEKVGKELEAILRRFLDYHIERRLNTVQFIKSLHTSSTSGVRPLKASERSPDRRA